MTNDEINRAEIEYASEWKRATRYQFSSPQKGEGHYPGCDAYGCGATRCAWARYQADFDRALKDGRYP